MRGTTSGIKPENEFSVFPLSRPRWLAVLATHIPRLPKKKPLRGKKVGFAEKNCAYSTYSIVFVDKWVNCLFGSFPHPFCGGGGRVPVCGFCSDLDQNRAVLWFKSEMKHLKHPKHLKHLKRCLWMFGLLFCQHFKELGGKVKDGVHRGQDQ